MTRSIFFYKYFRPRCHPTLQVTLALQSAAPLGSDETRLPLSVFCSLQNVPDFGLIQHRPYVHALQQFSLPASFTQDLRRVYIGLFLTLAVARLWESGLVVFVPQLVLLESTDFRRRKTLSKMVAIKNATTGGRQSTTEPDTFLIVNYFRARLKYCAVFFNSPLTLVVLGLPRGVSLRPSPRNNHTDKVARVHVESALRSPSFIL
ncbi:hypothetical protein NDU88_000685 [Pleurodeles waltl]|uniref:Uncharacterized protein n=1 Tax=Pleurodeles waltl TaxID=8319 RepID=A0AAV7NA92_PLEWA|nr:hypothetical protein NDU88_000685 [Pleurodeles waltl]